MTALIPFYVLVIWTLVWIGNTEESKVNCMNPQMNCWLRWLVQFTIDSFRATSDQVWVGSFRPWTQCFDFFPISRPNKGWILFREVYVTFVEILENGDIRWVWSLWSKCDLIKISCQTFSKSRFRRWKSVVSWVMPGFERTRSDSNSEEASLNNRLCVYV